MRPPSGPSCAPTYVLLTAARNEADFIERTLAAVAQQTIPPSLWVIVNDGSTDQTGPLVDSFARSYPFIRLVSLVRTGTRGFGSKVQALQRGIIAVGNAPYQFIGNIDADVSPPPVYFASLLERFASEPSLGIAGGWVHEDVGRGFRARPFNAQSAVAHAAQLVRRECFEAIGGYLPLPYGGEDACASVSAEMNGWLVRSYPDLPILHHRRTASAGGVCRSRFRMGLADWSLGYDPYYELFKCVNRLAERPLVLGSLFRLGGFVSAALKREARPVSAEFVRFLRNTQRKRLRSHIDRWPPRLW